MDAQFQSQLLQQLTSVKFSLQRLNLSLINTDCEQSLFSYNSMLPYSLVKKGGAV